MEPAGGGLPEQRADSSAVVPGKWDRGIHLFLLAEEGVPGLEGSPGGNLRRSAGHGGFSIPRARGSISGNQRRADPSLRGSGYEYAASTAPGGEVMLNDFNCSCPIYIACGYTDLRRGIDGLASIVQSQFQLDPFQKMLFLFCGRRQDRIKGLYWEGDGFLLLYKRLENGAFQWPRNKDEVRQLTPQQYRWLMEGLKTEQPKANKAVSGLSIL